MQELVEYASRYSYLKELDDKATAERGQLKVNVSDTSNE